MVVMTWFSLNQRGFYMGIRERADCYYGSIDVYVRFFIVGAAGASTVGALWTALRIRRIFFVNLPFLLR